MTTLDEPVLRKPVLPALAVQENDAAHKSKLWLSR